jgi:hypothetical protein
MRSPPLSRLFDKGEWESLKAELTKAVQLSYIVGVLDAWGDGAMLDKTRGETDGIYLKLVACFNGKMTGGQVFALVEKFMKDTPEQWHYRMSMIVANPMMEGCHLVPESPKK